MIQVVLRLEPNPTPLSVISSPIAIDQALTIIVKWGTVIPWSWTTWMDGRLYDSDVIEHLVSPVRRFAPSKHPDQATSERGLVASHGFAPGRGLLADGYRPTGSRAGCIIS